MTLASSDVSVVGDIAAANARKHPHSEAVVDGERRLTWRALHDRVLRLANALSDGLGLAPGDRASMLAENCLEYYEYFHATAAAGVIAAPLNQRLAPGELSAIVEQIEPRVIFCDGAHAKLAAAKLAAELAAAASCPVVRVGSEVPSDMSACWLPPARTTPADAPTRRRLPPSASPGAQPVFPRALSSRTAPWPPAARGTMLYQGLTGFDRHLFVRPMAVAPGHRMVRPARLLVGHHHQSPALRSGDLLPAGGAGTSHHESAVADHVPDAARRGGRRVRPLDAEDVRLRRRALDARPDRTGYGGVPERRPPPGLRREPRWPWRCISAPTSTGPDSSTPSAGRCPAWRCASSTRRVELCPTV